MQFKLNQWIIPIVVFVFIISAACVFVARDYNGDPLIISDYSYSTLQTKGDSFVTVLYSEFLNAILENYGAVFLVILQMAEILAAFSLIYLIARKIGLGLETKVLSFLLLCVCPAVLWHAAVINNNLFITLIVLALGLFTLYFPFAGILLSILLIFISPFHFFIFLAAILFYNRRVFIGMLACIIPLAFLFIGKNISLHNIIFEFGKMNGISAGLLIFAIAGLFTLSSKLKNQPGYYVLLIALFAKSILIEMDLLLLFPLLIFAVSALENYFSKKWSSRLLQIITTIMIIATLIIPFMFAVGKIISSLPDKEDYAGFASVNAMPKGNILAPKEIGFTIAFYSGKTALLNSAEKDKNKVNMTAALLNSRNLERTRSLLEHFDIKYIWISPHTDQRAWSGLIFMFRNNETFRKIYSNEGHEMWEVLEWRR